MFRKLAAAVASLALVLASVPAAVAAPHIGPALQSGNINGHAVDKNNNGLADYGVQLRGPDGTVIKSTTTNAMGQFTFANVPNGTYTIEITDLTGKVVATSSVTVTNGTVSITITSSLASAIGAAGAAGGGVLHGTGLWIVAGAVAAGTVATVVVLANRKSASPSR